MKRKLFCIFGGPIVDQLSVIKPTIGKNIIGALSKCLFFQYCDSNIGLLLPLLLVYRKLIRGKKRRREKREVILKTRIKTSINTQ